MKILLVVIIIVLGIIGMNQYEQYKLNKKANIFIEAVEDNFGKQIKGKSNRAKAELVCVQMSNIGQALKMFKLDNGEYPDTEEGLQALIENPDNTKYPNYPKTSYIQHMPKDSWRHSFNYFKNGTNFDLVSFGADGLKGGSGDGADIYFSQCKR